MGGLVGTTPEGGIGWPVPDYLRDLNAIYDAEKTLTMEQTWDYHSILVKFAIEAANNPRSIPIQRWTHGATAAQRAEAFLRALNLWKKS